MEGELQLEQLRELLMAYGMPVTQTINIINEFIKMADAQRDVGALLQGHDKLKEVFARPDLLQDLCEKGCTKDIKTAMEEAWKLATGGKQPDLEGLSRCIVKKDPLETQGKLMKHLDTMVKDKADELATSHRFLESVKVLLYVAQCMKISQRVTKNDVVVSQIRTDFERLERRHMPRVLAMLEGRGAMPADALDEAKEDFESILTRLEACRETAEGIRSEAAMSAFSSGLELAATLASVQGTWSLLSRGSQVFVAVKATGQFGVSATATYLAYLAHVQVGDLMQLTAVVEGYINNIAQARRQIRPRLGGA